MFCIKFYPNVAYCLRFLGSYHNKRHYLLCGAARIERVLGSVFCIHLILWTLELTLQPLLHSSASVGPLVLPLYTRKIFIHAWSTQKICICRVCNMQTLCSYYNTDVVYILQHVSLPWCLTGPQIGVGSSTCFKCTGRAKQGWKGIPTNSTESRHLLHILMHPVWRFNCSWNNLWWWHIQCYIQLSRWAMELQPSKHFWQEQQHRILWKMAWGNVYMCKCRPVHHNTKQQSCWWQLSWRMGQGKFACWRWCWKCKSNCRWSQLWYRFTNSDIRSSYLRFYCYRNYSCNCRRSIICYYQFCWIWIYFCTWGHFWPRNWNWCWCICNCVLIWDHSAKDQHMGSECKPEATAV